MRTIVCIVMVLVGALQAQQLEPTPEEKTHLELKQKDAMLDAASVRICELEIQVLQAQLTASRGEAAKSYRDLKDAGAKVIAAHHWTATFDEKTVTFSATPTRAEPKAEKPIPVRTPAPSE